MAKDLPYFKFYPSEWISGDITLEDLKTQGLFINICCYYWSQECVVSLEKLQKRFKNNKKQIQNLINEEIIYSDGDQIKIKFLDKQFDEREAVKHRNKANGLKGGRPKKTQSVNSGLAKNNPNITNIEESRGEEKKGEEKKKEQKDSQFDIFWADYPRKTGKGAARTSFAKAIKKATSDEIISGLLKHEIQTKTDVQFIPHPATWLNQERWTDEESEPKPQTEQQEIEDYFK